MREGQYMPRRGLFEASTRRHNRLGDHLQAVVIDLFLHLVADRAVPVNQEIEVARTERIEAHHLVGIIDDLFGILERQTVFGLGDQQQQFILYLRFIERFVFGLPGIAVIEMPVFVERQRGIAGHVAHKQRRIVIRRLAVHDIFQDSIVIGRLRFRLLGGKGCGGAYQQRGRKQGKKVDSSDHMQYLSIPLL